MQIPKTEYKISEIGEIPPAWATLRLDSICSIRNYESNESQTYIGLEHIGQGTNLLNSKGNIKDFTSTKNTFLKGDILYGKLRPLLNKVYLAEESGYCSTDILPLVVNDKILGKILLWNLSSEKFVKYANSTSSGTKMPRTNWNDMKKFLIAIPSMKEQQKIVSILSNVDELIQRTREIIEQIKRLKSGLTQRLLSKGIGHSKFKKTPFGEIPEEWKIVRVSDVCQGIVPGRNKPKQFDGNIPWITIEDIKGLYVSDSKLGLMITKEEVKKCSGKIIPPQSVIMTCVGNLGVVAIAKNEMVLNQQFHAFVCSKEILPYYLAVYLNLQKDYMYSIATTTTIPYMNRDNCNSIPIALPSKEEQQKIESILSSLDIWINQHTDEKSKLVDLKKGLMENLLTGKILVKV